MKHNVARRAAVKAIANHHKNFINTKINIILGENGMSKGVSLPINMIIILAIAVIVLLSVVAFYTGGLTSSTTSISDADAWNRGCGIWKLRGCNETDDFQISGYDFDGDGTADKLSDACRNYLGYTSMSDCHRVCCETEIPRIPRPEETTTTTVS